jgi:hypothetical protein
LNIDDLRSLEGLYRGTHPGFHLLAIEPIVLPVHLVTVEVLADEFQEFNQVYEFVLKFIDKGYVTPQRLAALMGFEEMVMIQLLAAMAQQGYILVNQEMGEERVSLSHSGRQMLGEMKINTPVSFQLKLVWDRVSWQLTPWDAGQLLNKRQLSSQFGEEFALAKTKYSSKKTGIDDFSPLAVNEILRQRDSRAPAYTIHQTVKVVERRDLNVVASLLIKRNQAGEIGLVVDFQGKRQIAIEQEIANAGGLESLGLDIEFTDEVSSAGVEGLPSGGSTAEPLPTQDDGFVDVYLHAAYLEDAMETAKERLLIVSPWITDGVVNNKFLERLERLLNKPNFHATIAWHYEDRREQRDSPRAIRALLKLATKYSKFHFIKIASTHAKILLKDSEYYISSSFNWLSYRGDRGTQLRMEIGEKRDEPQVVNSRFRSITEDISHRGSPTQESDIPAR